MSVQAMAWAIEQQIVTNPTARHVLLCLANYAGKTGEDAYPAVATLARETGLSRRAVQYKLDELRLAGVIVLGNQQVTAAKCDKDRRPVNYDLPHVANYGVHHVHPVHQVLDGVHVETERGAPGAPKPSITTRNRKSLEAGATPAVRGHRLPEEWKPEAYLTEFALSRLGSEPRVKLEIEKFRDYWRGVAGPKGVKLDWPATFRNWIRTAQTRNPGAPRAPTESRASLVDSAAQRIARQLAAAESAAGGAR